MKEKYGNIEKLEILGKNKANLYVTEQLLDKKLKNEGGENREEVSKRMEKAVKKIYSENIGKKIAIVSHGAAIKFLLMEKNWCRLNTNNQLEYNGIEIKVNSPSVIKLTIQNNKLIKLEVLEDII